MIDRFLNAVLKNCIHFSDFINMKVNIEALILLLFLMLSVSSFAESNGNINDPLGNSYIINNLEMESSSDPEGESSESLSGEIIFDDTFSDLISSPDNKNKNKSANTNILNDLKRKDSRWHLIEYRVKKNDSVWKIAKRNGISPSVILSINNISSKGIIRENEILFIPSKTGVKYKIKRGDTLTSIADRYDTDIEKIAEHNNIDGKKIIAGRSIFIPGAEEKKEPLLVRKYRNKSEKREAIALEKSRKSAKTERKEKEIAAELSGNKDQKLRLSWPLKGPITSGFGYRKHPFSGKKSFHCGLDIGAEVGTSVRSAGDGKVIFSGWKEAYGNLIVIQHKNNYITVYAHNSKLLVEVDENVKKGQKIAQSGKTGAVTGAHLHFEIRKGIVPLNPSRILK